MKRFSPLITQLSPSRVARVRTLAASDPAPASVSAKAASILPLRQIRHPALLLLVRAAVEQRQRAQLLDGRDQAARGAHPAELLDDEQSVEIMSAAQAAVLVRKRQRQEVVLAQQLDDVPRELAAAVDLGRARRDLVLGQLAHGVAQRALIRVQNGHRPDRSACARQALCSRSAFLASYSVSDTAPVRRR